MAYMTSSSEHFNNPLHGVKLETLLNELVSHYGFEILAEYTNINCFKNRPTLASSLKFLKKTEWAREKMERFYLYNYKNLPKADDIQYEIPPRQRVIPAHQKPREPKALLPGEAPKPKERTSDRKSYNRNHSNSGLSDQKNKSRKQDSKRNVPSDPWANAPK